MKLDPAINQLNISRDVLTTNEPINRREGRIEQADLEKKNAESYKAAIEILKNSPTMKRLKNQKI